MKRFLSAAAVSVLVAVATVQVARAGVQQIKDPDGNAVGVVVTCETCRNGAEQACPLGTEKGWVDGLACGDCLMSANMRERLLYHYDLHITGKLVSAAGAPMKDRFLRLFFSNGWTVRARAAEDGSFHLMMGATAEKKGKQPLVVDLGSLRDYGQGNYFALYFLPPEYHPCAEPSPAAGHAAKKRAKKH